MLFYDLSENKRSDFVDRRKASTAQLLERISYRFLPNVVEHMMKYLH